MSKDNRRYALDRAIGLGFHSGASGVVAAAEVFLAFLEGPKPEPTVAEPEPESAKRLSPVGPDGKPLDFAKYRYFRHRADGPKRRVDAHGKVEVYRRPGGVWGESMFSLRELTTPGGIFIEVTG